MSIDNFAAFSGPHAVARHPQLEPEVKRAILASWASDKNAVRSQPSLRKLPGTRHPVPVRHVLDALQSLDCAAPHRPGAS
jgi:hypothetical protein